MTKYVHIVYVHPVELGEPNLYKVKREEEFNTREDALMWARFYNQHRDNWNIKGFEAVYYGKVNDATGELV